MTKTKKHAKDLSFEEELENAAMHAYKRIKKNTKLKEELAVLGVIMQYLDGSFVLTNIGERTFEIAREQFNSPNRFRGRDQD